MLEADLLGSVVAVAEGLVVAGEEEDMATEVKAHVAAVATAHGDSLETTACGGCF